MLASRRTIPTVRPQLGVFRRSATWRTARIWPKSTEFSTLPPPTSLSILSSSPRLRHYSTDAPQPTQPPPPPPPPEKSSPDHRDLGVQQELFTTSVYSPGSPIFLPNGTRVFNRLVDFLRKQYVRYGFQEVITPTIYKKSLWAKSGHLDNYAEDMFTVTSGKLAAEKEAQLSNHDHDHHNHDHDHHDHDNHHHDAATLEHEYGLKPMNCPGHCLIFDAQRHSYRDLPIRYADFSPLHRDEISGALTGLTRVRRFHQDDGHIFCRPSQVEDEIRATLDFVRFTYDVLGLGPYRLVLSTRPTDGHLIGSDADWDAAEDALRRALDHHTASTDNKKPWTLNPGDGAFYGPKIDIVLQDAVGKEHQTATVQLDFQLPRRFGLTYHVPTEEQATATSSLDKNEQTARDGLEDGLARPVMIHRAVLGSVERLLALLIEHYNGRWPFWLNPRQVAVLTVNDSDDVVAFARRVQGILSGAAALSESPTESTTSTSTSASTILSAPSLLAAVDLDLSARSVSLKVREAKSKGYGAIVVVGPKDVAKGTVAVDLSGIPVKATSDQPKVDNNTTRKKRETIEMKPEELLHLLQNKVNLYQ